MPIVAHNSLPSFQRLRDEGINVLSPDRASNQDIRELHIGLLNMMPDSALFATERQFFRLIGESNPIAQFYIHPFSLSEFHRSREIQKHIDSYYETFDQLREKGLDALIITGANVSGLELSEQPFWEPLIEIVDWAYENVTSTLCSCLATHAVLEFRYKKKRKLQKEKKWGVFSHKIVMDSHPLVSDVNTRFDVPHSRWNEISQQQFLDANLHILAESKEAGVHLATSSDGLRFVFFQGHPEYDTISLFKEFKREVGLYVTGDTLAFPPFVENYFNDSQKAVIREFKRKLVEARIKNNSLPDFPESLIVDTLDNTWHDTAESIMSNWIGLVYQVTHRDRKKPFMDNINPKNPLQL
tara:strand:- start:12117 stop:13181 length:1065 start_codon:yes stop_codon:yes gene_type:complete